MTPEQIASDPVLRDRFLNEIAHAAQTEPAGTEADLDAALLASQDGALVVAWLWPHALYGGDPFAQVASRREALRKLLHGEPTSAELLEVSRAIDRWRRALRGVAVHRLERMLESIAQAIHHSVVDLKAHLAWSVPLAEMDLDLMLRGSRAMPLAVIPAICRALQLNFVDEGWVLTDPQQLEQRVEHSLLSMQIARRLRGLASDDLVKVAKRLPKGVRKNEERHPALYLAPAQGGRYDSLYQVLAKDRRASPTYSLSEVDRVLVGAGEKPLPDSAKGRSWWAGSGAKIEGRPQVSAWWAAGYRVKDLMLSDGEVVAVDFEALPGRDAWLASPDVVSAREYRPPEPPQVPIYPADAHAIENMIAGLRTFDEATKSLRESVDLDGVRRVVAGVFDEIGRVAELNRLAESPASDTEAMPQDNDIRELVAFLRDAGDATRSEIEQLFEQARGRPIDGSSLTNLLTRARRQGWIANLGSRSQPKWVLSPRCPTCLSRTLLATSSSSLKCATCGRIASTAGHATAR